MLKLVYNIQKTHWCKFARYQTEPDQVDRYIYNQCLVEMYNRVDNQTLWDIHNLREKGTDCEWLALFVKEIVSRKNRLAIWRSYQIYPQYGVWPFSKTYMGRFWVELLASKSTILTGRKILWQWISDMELQHLAILTATFTITVP